LENVIIEVKDKTVFLNIFLQEYLSRGFGSLSKREIDILVMNLLVKYADLDNVNNFDLSLKLKLTESKIRNLKYEANLKYRENTEEYIKKSFFILLKKARLTKNKTINIAIEDNFLRNAIKAKVKESGSYTDSSFNSEIVKIEIDDFVYLLDCFYTDAEKIIIIDEINQLLSKNNIDFKDLFKLFLEEAVKSSGSEIGKQGVLLGIGYISGGVIPLVSSIKNLLKG